MKSFVQYLRESGKVSPEKLVEALVTQSSFAPSLADSAYRERWLSAEQTLAVVLLMAEGEWGLIGACRQLGFYTPELGERFSRHLTRVLPPLTKILVDHSTMNYVELNHALDHYLNEARATQSPAEAPAVPSVSVVETKVEAKGEARDPEYAPSPTTPEIFPPDVTEEEAGDPLQPLIGEDELEVAAALLRLLAGMETAEPAARADVVLRLYHVFHKITGVLTLAGFSRLSQESAEVESALQRVLKGEESLGEVRAHADATLRRVQLARNSSVRMPTEDERKAA